MTRPTLGKRAWLACVGLLSLSGAHAAGLAVEKTLNIDLAPKIEASMAKRERFAVDVPHTASLEIAGQWETSGAMSVWRYSVSIPTAVSMSFRADRFKLPAGAALNVTARNGTSATYTSASGSGELWGRVQRGDALQFEIRVATRDRAEVEFKIANLYAGYRGLGGGVADHPHFRKLQKQMAATTASCIENYSCHATPEKNNNADATAALVIGGIAQCTGTLINNLRHDGTPYLLTARHCQEGPAGSVFVFWNAVTPCGELLGSLYEGIGYSTGGTHTVFEQQDVWLLELGDLSASQGYFSGWDATGAAFIGGYSPHHAIGRNLQYAEWIGQSFLYDLPASVRGVGYDSTYWGVVNSLGSIGGGASGGGVFDPEHRLVGVASLAYLDDSGEGMCPLNPPPVPDAYTSTALYNALSAVWDTNADTTSFTNPVTLKSLLDPDNTGATVSPGLALLRGMAFTRDREYASTGSLVTLHWGGGGTGCTASGGTAGDGWTGPRPPDGSFDVTQFEPGYTNYTLRCTDGTRTAVRTLQIIWTHSAPALVFGAQNSTEFVGGNARLFWRSNVTPCVATGGRVGDGWAGTRPARGSVDIPLSQPGSFNYAMTCGTGSRTVSANTNVGAQSPVAQLQALSNNMRVNHLATLTQTAYGASCVRTGGVPGDGWEGATSNFPIQCNVDGSRHLAIYAHVLGGLCLGNCQRRLDLHR